MRTGLAVATLAAALTGTGCASTYRPPTSGPTAVIQFTGPFGYLTIDDQQDRCPRPALYKDLTRRPEGVVVQAGQTLWFTQGVAGSPHGKSCGFDYSFTPEVGKTYEASYEQGSNECYLNLYVLKSGVRADKAPVRLERPSKVCF